jgi:pyruvate dehydrogenase E2 component (dihydrolipoamide acetyltransferase)
MAEIVTMPKLGFDMAEGTLVRWVINEGDRVEKGMPLAEIETDKATVEVESSHAGVMLRHLVSAGDIEPEEISPEIEDSVQPAAEAEPVEKPVEVGSLPDGVRATPLARRIAEERGIDISLVKGSGPQGRILKVDVEAYQPEVKEAEEKVSKTQPIRVREARQDVIRKDVVAPLSRLRAAIGKRMAESARQSPHFFVTHDYDAAPLMAMRKQYNSLVSEDEKLSVNDFIVKAVALTLRQFPNLNASLDEVKQQVTQHGAIIVGVAVAVENGLLTVVCRETDKKPMAQIGKEIKEMVERVRAGKVKSEDIEGSTFSVSNLGMFDVDQFTAIINPPEAAILAIGAAKQVPVVFPDGTLGAGARLKITISADHRVTDGAEAAQFMQEMKRLIENPLSLLI